MLENKEALKYTKDLVLLYVEDEEMIYSKMLKTFEIFFKKVIFTNNGQDGITKFNENHIDIVISDINMPNLNGIEMLKQINSLAPNTPSILITAHQDKQYYKDAVELNINSFIPKPVDLDKLIKSIFTISKNYI